MKCCWSDSFDFCKRRQLKLKSVVALLHESNNKNLFSVPTYLLKQVFYLFKGRCSFNPSSCQVAARVQTKFKDRTRKMGKGTAKDYSKAGSTKYYYM